MDPGTLVLSVGPQMRHAWQTVYGAWTHVIVMDSVEELFDALRALENAGVEEIHRVMLDRSVGADGFLSILSRLPASFAGDVVWIRDEGGFVSSVVPGQRGRLLFEMDGPDLGLYLDAHFAMSAGRPALGREGTA